MKEYEPELGQAVFGQPWQEIECPDYIESHLSFISNELKRVMLNLGKDFENPFGNTGNVTGFKNNIFEVIRLSRIYRIFKCIGVGVKSRSSN